MVCCSVCAKECGGFCGVIPGRPAATILPKSGSRMAFVIECDKAGRFARSYGAGFA